jgi:transposase-like protein
MEGILNGTNGGHDVQVSAKIPRRRFTAAYKLKVVREADGCSEQGELGALLRREGLYSSHLVTWRRARDRGELVNAPKRGRKPKTVDPSAKRVAELERKLAKAEARAEHAEALVELQKKVAALLGRPFPSEGS